MNFFILGEFPELPENFRIPNYPRMRTSYEYIMRAMGKETGSRQIQNPIEICPKWSHRANIALYLDRIH